MTITVGIDIGTTSVKALAADGDGNIVARARVPHPFSVPTGDAMEHDANRAWRRGPRRALAALGDVRARGLCVAAMVLMPGGKATLNHWWSSMWPHLRRAMATP